MRNSVQPLADQRAAPRSSLLLRSAKVVCQSGEYLCLVRDVSASGAGLRFFHAVPPESRIFLELGNGAIHPVERVWARDCEAGYRFASAVDVEEFIAERSDHATRAIRLRLEQPALVSIDGRDSHATLRDISRTGARLEGDRAWPLRAFARIEVAGMPMRFGHVRWRQGTAHGIVFHDVVPLNELAQHLLALQPFAAAPIEPTGPSGWAIRAA